MIWHVILFYLLYRGGRRWFDEKHLKQKNGAGGLHDKCDKWEDKLIDKQSAKENEKW